jgi:hypothetical protein
MTNYNEISSKIVEQIKNFESSLIAHTGFRHQGASAHANVIECFAKSIIDAEFGDKKMENLKTVEDLLMRLVKLGKEV